MSNPLPFDSDPARTDHLHKGLAEAYPVMMTEPGSTSPDAACQPEWNLNPGFAEKGLPNEGFIGGRGETTPTRDGRADAGGW